MAQSPPPSSPDPASPEPSPVSDGLVKFAAVLQILALIGLIVLLFQKPVSENAPAVAAAPANASPPSAPAASKTTLPPPSRVTVATKTAIEALDATG